MVASEVLETLFAKAATRISEYLELEHTPYTLNNHYFSQTRDDIMSALKSARERAEPYPFGSNAEAIRQQKQQRLTEALAALAACGYSGVKADQLPRLLGPDVHEEALDAAGQTVAYWKIAYKVSL